MSSAVVAPQQPRSFAVLSRPGQPASLTGGSQGPAGPPGATGPAGPQGPQGQPAGQLTFTAGGIISGHRALMIQPDDTAVHADPNAPGYVFAGVSLGAAQAGAVVVAEDDGQIVEPSWSWSPGLPVFALAGGLLSQAAPSSGVLHLIGFAVNPTTLRVAPQPPILIV